MPVPKDLIQSLDEALNHGKPSDVHGMLFRPEFAELLCKGQENQDWINFASYRDLIEDIVKAIELRILIRNRRLLMLLWHATKVLHEHLDSHRKHFSGAGSASGYRPARPQSESLALLLIADRSFIAQLSQRFVEGQDLDCVTVSRLLADCTYFRCVRSYLAKSLIEMVLCHRSEVGDQVLVALEFPGNPQLCDTKSRSTIQGAVEELTATRFRLIEKAKVQPPAEALMDFHSIYG